VGNITRWKQTYPPCSDVVMRVDATWQMDAVVAMQCILQAVENTSAGGGFRNVRVQHAGWCLQRARSKLADHTKVRVPKRFIIPPGELFEAVKLISGAMVGDMNGTYGVQSIAEDLTWAEAFLKHWWVDNNGKEYLI